MHVTVTLVCVQLCVFFYESCLYNCELYTDVVICQKQDCSASMHRFYLKDAQLVNGIDPQRAELHA